MRRERQNAFVRQLFETTALFVCALLVLLFGARRELNLMSNLTPKSERMPSSVIDSNQKQTKRKYFSRHRSQVIPLGCIDKMPSEVALNSKIVRFTAESCGHLSATPNDQFVNWTLNDPQPVNLTSFHNFQQKRFSSEFVSLKANSASLNVSWQSKNGKVSNKEIRLKFK